MTNQRNEAMVQDCWDRAAMRLRSTVLMRNQPDDPRGLASRRIQRPTRVLIDDYVKMMLYVDRWEWR